MKPSGDCLFEAILQQLKYNPQLYNVKKMREQVAYNIAKNWDVFSPYMPNDSESYESVIRNTFEGNNYGDVYLAGVVAWMWMIKITII